MPHIFTDEQSHTAEPGVKGSETVTASEVALFVKHPVGGEIDLAVDVPDLPAFEIDRSVVKTVIRTLLD